MAHGDTESEGLVFNEPEGESNCRCVKGQLDQVAVPRELALDWAVTGRGGLRFACLHAQPRGHTMRLCVFVGFVNFKRGQGVFSYPLSSDTHPSGRYRQGTGANCGVGQRERIRVISIV